MTRTNDDRKTRSDEELAKEADAGLRGQGAVVEMNRRIGEQSTKAAQRAGIQSWIAIAIALAALVVSVFALCK